MLPLLLFLFQEAPTFRADVRLVHVDVEARKGQQIVAGLTKDDFRVTDNGRAMPVLYVGQQEEPLDIILLLDTSASMRPVVERVAGAASTALAQLREGDRIALMAFDRDWVLVDDFSSDFAAVARAIRERVLTRTFPRSTHIQETVDVAARHFLSKSSERTDAKRRRAVLIVTDNLGTGHESNTVQDLWEADAVLSGVIVKNAVMAAQYSIVFPTSLFGIGGMSGIAEKTGGDTVKLDDAGEGLKQMIQRLRLRYSLYYAAPEGKVGEERKIKVETERPRDGIRIRARSGYRILE